MDDQDIRDRDSETKETGKLFAYQKSGALDNEVKEDDTVLLKLERTTDL